MISWCTGARSLRTTSGPRCLGRSSRTSAPRRSRPRRGRGSAGAQAPEACGLLLDPVALVVLRVLLLHGAPGRGVGAALLAVLIFGGVQGLLVDLLGVL